MVDETVKKKIIPIDTPFVCPLSMVSDLVDELSGMPVLKHCVSNCRFYLKTKDFEGCVMVLYFLSDIIPYEKNHEVLEGDGHS